MKMDMNKDIIYSILMLKEELEHTKGLKVIDLMQRIFNLAMLLK